MPYDPTGYGDGPYPTDILQAPPPDSARRPSGLFGALGQEVMGAPEKYTGARAVRGLLAGQPRELLSVVPFSDILGLTDPRQRVSGQQLLGTYGLDPGGTAGRWAGAAAEELTNPLAWLAPLPLTRAGAAAKAAGVLPAGAAERVATPLSAALAKAPPALAAEAERFAGGPAQLAQMGGERLGGVVGLRTPWQAEPYAVLGASPGGESFARGVEAFGRRAQQAEQALGQVPVVGPLWEQASPYLPALFRHQGLAGLLGGW